MSNRFRALISSHALDKGITSKGNKPHSNALFRVIAQQYSLNNTRETKQALEKL
jgi:hypothetical protein